MTGARRCLGGSLRPRLPSPGPGTALAYEFCRAGARLASEAAGGIDEKTSEGAAGIDTTDLDAAAIWDWTDDQLLRAWRSGFLLRLKPEFWEELATEDALLE